SCVDSGRLGASARRGEGMHLLRQVEDLTGELEELLVLVILFLDGLPLLVRDHLALGVGAVLADQEERREEDRLERDDHRQQTVWIGLDAEADPATEPERV